MGKVSMKLEREGFTLIELLVVIGIIIILAAVTIIAINPGRQFSQARDAERSSEVNQILNGVSQWLTESGNTLEGTTLCGIAMATCADPAVYTNIGTGLTECDLGATLAPVFISEIPADPTGASGTDTGYDICRSGTRVSIHATGEMTGNENIIVTR